MQCIFEMTLTVHLLINIDSIVQAPLLLIVPLTYSTYVKMSLISAYKKILIK
jgi:hypothetical protein